MNNHVGDRGDALERRRKRLKFRSWHRGTLELDLLLGPFADRHIDHMAEDALAEYEAVLSLPDLEVFEWITGKAPVPATLDSPVFQLIRKFHKTA